MVLVPGFMVFRSCQKPSPLTTLSGRRSPATNSAISLVIVVARSGEYLQTIVVNVACFTEELGPPKVCLYSSGCFANNCKVKLVVPPPWTRCTPHSLHRTFLMSFPFSLASTDALKYSQIGLVRFLVDMTGRTSRNSQQQLRKPRSEYPDPDIREQEMISGYQITNEYTNNWDIHFSSSNFCGWGRTGLVAICPIPCLVNSLQMLNILQSLSYLLHI